MDMGNYYNTGKPEKDSNKPSWGERARLSHSKFGEFFRKYGDQLSTAGNVGLLMGGGAMLMASAASSTPLTTTLALTSGAAAVAAGCLRIGNIEGSQRVAEKNLQGASSVFDIPFKKVGEAANSSARGATLNSDDPFFQDPHFRKAVASAFQQLADDPEAKAGFAEMIENSSSMRRALMNAQKNIDAADEMRNANGQSAQHDSPAADDQDDRPGMTMH